MIDQVPGTVSCSVTRTVREGVREGGREGELDCYYHMIVYCMDGSQGVEVCLRGTRMSVVGM